MAQKSNVLELNGKRYDAYTGELLTSSTIPSAKSPRTRSIDGFMKSSAQPTLKAVKSAPKKTTQTHPVTTVPATSQAARPISDFTRQPATHVQHHKTSSSQTLMRHAVAKPKPSLKRHVKSQQRTDVLVKQPSITVQPKLSSYQLDPKRIARSQRVPRHPSARRYALDRAALAPQPVRVAVPATNPQPAATPSVKPVYADASAQALRLPQTPQARSTDIFEQALARANSHHQKPLTRRQAKRRKSLFGGRALSIGATSCAVLLLVGFFAWQSRANLTMHYAASKAGVAASMPGYKPAGFSAGKFSYSPGIVAVNFNNNKSGKNFALIEKTTSWDSTALLDSFVATRSRTYQTIDAAGRTIYTYGNNNATWVDNGVWYQVNTQGSLSTNELVNLAVSM